MKIDIKLAAGVSVLCLVLFLGVIGIGTINSKPVENEGTEHSVTEEFSTQGQDTETLGTEEEQPAVDEYISFAIADVNKYVNVRQEPTTDAAIIGKIYDGAVAQILATVGEGENQWFQMVSGNVEGYIKAEFFIHGEAAAAVMDQYVSKYVRVNVERLNVREGQTTESRRIGYVCAGEELDVIEVCGDWICVQYTDDIKGYVYAEYVTVFEAYTYAKNEADELEEYNFTAILKERAGISDTVVKEETTVAVKPPAENYSTNADLRKAIIDYAMQYLGDKYVHGGQSLETGTDCSGFTMLVLAEFGYSISRTPQGQYTGAGRAISYEEIQPGDIICYSSNGGASCTHVAFYIGDGKILHASNPRDGVKISSATYTNIYGVRNVID